MNGLPVTEPPAGVSRPSRALPLDATTPSRRPGAVVPSFLAALAFAALLAAVPMPSGNEYVYLVAPWKIAHPDFLRGDWTMTSYFQEGATFNLLVALPMRVLPFALIGWIVRIAGWTAVLAGIFRLGDRLRVSPPWIAGAFCLWMLQGQSLFGGEWFIGGAEAKVFSYALLFFGIDALIAERDILGAALIGACVSLHASVGVSAGAGVAIAVLASRPRLARLARMAAVGTLCALPGVLPLLPELLGNGTGDSAAWRFVTLVTQPHHFDALAFPKRAVLLCAIMLAFNILFARITRRPALRWLAWFQLGLAGVCLFGFLARATEHYAWLKFFPFRLFPLLVPLLFLLTMALLLQHREALPGRRSMLLLGAVVLMGLEEPIAAFSDKVALTRSQWEEPDDLKQSFAWLGGHAPPDAMLILPPWRKDGFYLASRPQVVSLTVPRYDRLDEWRARVESLCHALPEGGGAPQTFAACRAHYARLTRPQLEALARRYGATHLLSEAQLDFPVLHAEGVWRVYDLRTVPRTP